MTPQPAGRDRLVVVNFLSFLLNLQETKAVPTKYRRMWLQRRIREEFKRGREAHNPEHIDFLIRYADASLDNLKDLAKSLKDTPQMSGLL